MKREYKNIEIEILMLQEDVIRTSTPFSPKPGDNELPFVPFSE